MPGIKKLVGITGLNTEHPLYGAVTNFIDVSDVITSYPSGAIYSSAATAVDDADLGMCREFDANGDVISPTVPIAINGTVLAVYKYLGGAAEGFPINDTYFFNYVNNGNQFKWQTASTSNFDYRTNRRFNFGTSVDTDYEPYNQNVTLKRTPRASAISYGAGSPFMYSNGVAFTANAGAGGASGTPSINPIQVSLMPSIGSNGAIRLSAFVVFNRLLTDAELIDITQNPWDLVVGTLPLEASISAALTPGATITATLINYPALPTTVTIADSRGNDIVLPLTATGATTATFTVPALASSNAGPEYLQFGAVNLTFGNKTISSTFSPVSPLVYVTLLAPVATNAFEAWGSDVPVAGEQLISEGNFDINGNFTGADPEATYTCWITRLNGDNHRFTVQQGSAEPPNPDSVLTLQDKKLALIVAALLSHPTLSVNDAIMRYLQNLYSSNKGISDLIARFLGE